VRIGVNGRLDTLQAAILLVKLGIFDEELAAKQRIAIGYGATLYGVAGVTVPRLTAGLSSAWAQYTLRIGRRDALAKALALDGIPTQVYYPRPLSAQPAYRRYPVADGGTPVAARISGEVLSLPVHASLGPDVVARCTTSIVGATAG
jgi:dTDP-4-amino-4,6-dideoxygalactose transaminase